MDSFSSWKLPNPMETLHAANVRGFDWLATEPYSLTQATLRVSYALALWVVLPTLNAACTRTPSQPRSLDEPKLTTVAVEAIGKDFQWHFRFPGPDSRWDTPDDVMESKTLLLPPDVDVYLQVSSEDYIYTFAIPEFGVSEVGVPGLTHRLRFHTGPEASYPLRADPMCGLRLLHSDMMGQVTVQRRSDHTLRFGAGPPIRNGGE